MKRKTFGLLMMPGGIYEDVTLREVKGFEGLSFFTHRAYGWQMSEVSTGLAINDVIYETEREAIEAAEAFLNLKGKSQVKEQVEVKIKERRQYES